MRSLSRATLLAVLTLGSPPARAAKSPIAPQPAAGAAPRSAPAPLSPETTSSSKGRALSAEVAYPRSPAEAEILGGYVLLLVTAKTTNSADLPLAPPTLHFADGTAAPLVQMVGQIDDDGREPSDPAAVRFRYSGLFYLPFFTTATSARVTVVFGGTPQVVVQFPRPASAYPVGWPTPKPGSFSTPAVAALASKRYPFFRIPPLKDPAKETTCPAHALEPEAASIVESAKNYAHGKADKGPPDKGDGGAGGNRRVVGSLDKEAIRGIIRAHVDEVRGCYERELREQKDLRGRVLVQFTIRRDGWVAESALESATLPSPPVSDCIVAAVRCWRFPAPRGGGSVIVTYPFVLEPMDLTGLPPSRL